MVSGKRILVATITGLVFGVLCYLMLLQSHPSTIIPRSGMLAVILSRGVLGFAIGVSACPVSWWLHGIVMGFIFSLPGGFGAIWMGFGRPSLIWVLVIGMAIGFLVELVASILFKAPMSKNSGAAQQA